MDPQAAPQAASQAPPPEWAAQLYQLVQAQNQRMESLEQQLREQQNGGSTFTPETAATTNEDIVREPTAVRKKNKLPELPEFSGKRVEFRP